jgi:acetyl esterase/lipase
MPKIRILRDIVYAQPDGHPQQLDLYLPQDAPTPLPLVIWIHGGAFRMGDKENPPAERLVARGYAVASINYRLSQVALFPAQLHDCKAAVRWLRAHATIYQLDAQRFGAWGSSAGGHLVAMLGTTGGVAALEGDGGHAEQSSQVQAVCDFYGPTDFSQMDTQGSEMHHDAPDSPESQLVGGAIQAHPDRVAQANPIPTVLAGRVYPPFLIMHGDRDPLVPIGQSVLLYEALRRVGAEVTFRTVPGAGHGFAGPEIDQAVDEFFDRHLRHAG